VRSHLGYPTDIYDVALVYSGTSPRIVDRNAFSRYATQYYTVFVMGLDGTISSGAVVKVTRPAFLDEAGNSVVPSASGTPPLATSTEVSLPTEPVILIFGFEAANIFIRQADTVATFLSEGISLVSTLPFTISIPYEAAPDYLKAIVVTLLDPTDQRRSYSFLLRLNNLGTAYEATIEPLNVIGESRLQVEIFDFERFLVGRYRAPVAFTILLNDAPLVFFPDAIMRAWPQVSVGLFGFLVLGSFWWFVMWLRRRKTEDNR